VIKQWRPYTAKDSKRPSRNWQRTASREQSRGRVPAFIRILMSCDLRKCRTGKLRWQKLRHVCTRARGLLTIGPISGARMAETASRVYTRKRLSAKVRNLIGCQLGEVYDGRPLCPKSCRVCTHAKDFLTGVHKELRPPPGKGGPLPCGKPSEKLGRGTSVRPTAITGGGDLHTGQDSPVPSDHLPFFDQRTPERGRDMRKTVS
jgi:hypothetical protein